MVTIAIWGCAAVGAVTLAAALPYCLCVVLFGDIGRARSAAAAAVGRRRYLEDMPGHPERLRRLEDPKADAAFWDLAEALPDDVREPNLTDVCNELGWLR